MRRKRNEKTRIFPLLLVACLAIAAGTSCAWAQTQSANPPTGKSMFNLFQDKLSPRKFFDGQIVDLTTEEQAKAEQAAQKASPVAKAAATAKPQAGPVFVSNDPMSHIVPPDEDPKVRINPEAPGPFIAMADAFQRGDLSTARAYADQYVRYQLNLMYEVRAITDLIVEALIRNGVVEEDEAVGVGQYLDIAFSKAREKANAPMRPNHEESLKRVTADPGGRAEIYYFFSLDCQYCVDMAGDIERLWRVVQGDKRLKMTALTLTDVPKTWVNSYRSYTGLTLPIMKGAEVAKHFRVGFVPAMVVIAPGTKTAYFKSGQQDFQAMYEFVRTVQGASTTITPPIARLMRTPVGQAELDRAKGDKLEDKNIDFRKKGKVQLRRVGGKKTKTPDGIDRF